MIDLVDVERKIVIGMINSTEFLKQAITIVDTKWVQSKEAKILINWIEHYFKRYKKAPKSDIQEIYFEKLRTKKIQKKQAEVIEHILTSLSDQSDSDTVNLEYLMDLTQDYCKACKLQSYAEEVLDQLDEGNILEAEHLLSTFKPVEVAKSEAVHPLGTVKQIKKAFESVGKPLIRYPGALGNMLNPYMVEEGFVVFLGQNKGGKSFFLLDAAMRAAAQGKNVVMFQAGDMSQSQFERREAIYLAKKSDMRKYCGELLIPILDCCWNLNNNCEMDEREGGDDKEVPFEKLSAKKIRDIHPNVLREAFNEYYDHIPCYNCLRTGKLNRFKGAIWYKKRDAVEPLTWKDAYKLIQKKYNKLTRRIKLITYPNGTLTMQKIEAETDILEKNGFSCHVHLIDYLDLLEPDRDTFNMKPNDQENVKWKRARRFSQERKSLVLSGSQSDAQGFDVKFLTKKNFSTDRRKLDHVTAMVGLNMSIDEKIKGIMRVNDIAARESEGIEFVHVLHRLQIGRPILGSYY